MEEVGNEGCACRDVRRVKGSGDLRRFGISAAMC